MKFSREVKIGISGIIALFLIVFGINYLKGINMFKPTNYFYVKYSNILGLTKSSAVYADGFRLGLVRDIHYDYTHPGNVIVEIQLDSEMKIPEGAYAELSTEMLGGVNMNLILPSHQNKYYAPGDTIPGKARPGLMEHVSADMLPKVEALLPKVDSILTSINTLLNDPNLVGSLAQFKRSSENLTVMTENLKNFTGHDLPQLTQTMNRVGGSLEQFTTDLNKLELDRVVESVNATLVNVQNVTDKLNRKDNTVGLLLNDDSLYINLNKTVTNASALFEDLKAHPKRYVHFSVFGRKDK